MSSTRASQGSEFLTVAEAAERLGQSRLRVREAAARGLLTSRRDNEGRLRVDIPAGIEVLSGGDLAPDAVVEFLFDEVEEMEASGADKNARIAVLVDLVERQSAALDRADAALSRSERTEARLGGLLDRALTHLERGDTGSARLAAVSDRALGHLETVGAGLEKSLAQSARFEALLSRALDVAESREGLGPAAERAFRLLEDAVARAEAGQVAAERTGQMLDRALSAGERLQDRVADSDRRIAAQERTIENALTMSERAVALASAAEGNPRKRRGFFAWLFGS